MKRIVFLIERVCLSGGYESTSKVATTYAAAVNAFKTLVADTLIFNAIWDMHIDGEKPTGENLLIYGGGTGATYNMHTHCGKSVYEFPSEKNFLKNDYDHSENEDDSTLTVCNGEITLDVGPYVFLLRAIEEEF